MMMRTVAPTVVAALVVACSRTDPKPSPPALTKTSIEIANGQTQPIGGSSFALRFLRVREDSRCPEGVACVWAGNAAVELTLVGGGSDTTFVLNSAHGDSTAIAHDLRFGLAQLRPHPKAGTTIAPESYVATISVEPVGR